MRMRLAFFVEQVQQLCCPLFHAVWAKLGSKRRRWEKRRALFYDDALESMRQRFEARLYGVKKSAPIVASDTSSSPWFFPDPAEKSRETASDHGRESTPGSRGVATFSRRVLSCSVSKNVSKAGHRRTTGGENALLIGSYTIV
jgi:hypothetical protein